MNEVYIISTSLTLIAIILAYILYDHNKIIKQLEQIMRR